MSKRSIGLQERSKFFGIPKWILVVLLMSLFLFFFRWYFYHKALNSFGMQTKGVVVNEKNWVGKKRNGISRLFTYSYRFFIKGKTYTEDCNSNNHEVGEIVKVEYLDFCPSINRISK